MSSSFLSMEEWAFIEVGSRPRVVVGDKLISSRTDWSVCQRRCVSGGFTFRFVSFQLLCGHSIVGDLCEIDVVLLGKTTSLGLGCKNGLE